MPRPNDVGVGTAALILKDRRILLLCRKGAHAAGLWAVPGGWIDRSDRSVSDVICREINEEVGLRVLGEPQLHDVTTEDHADLNCRTVTIYYRVWTVGVPTIQEPEKCSAIKWLTGEEALALPLFPGLAGIIEKLKSSGVL